MSQWSGTIGGGTALSDAGISVTGASTFYWLWWPPTDPQTGQPLYSVFGIPDTYFLAGVGGGCSATTNSSDPSLSASGSLSDGWGTTLSFNQVNQSVPGSSPLFPSRRIVHSTSGSVTVQLANGLGTASGKTSGASLSPSLTLQMDGGGPSTANLSGGASLQESDWPIVISAPSPLGHPDYGNGTNQIEYDDSPSGVLSLWAQISAPGPQGSAQTADMQWLLNGGHVDLFLNPVIAGELPFSWQASGENIQANTPGNFIGSSQYPSNDLLFVGLPSSINSFGLHTLKLKVDGNDSEWAYFQTFFSPIVSNYPGTNGITANWYYYYGQIYAPTGAYDSSSGDSYTDLGSPGNPIHLRDTTYGPGRSLQVFALDPGAQYVSYVGYIDLPTGLSNYV